MGRPQGEGGRTGDLLLILVKLIGRGRLEVGGRGWPVRLQSVMPARGHGRGRRGRRAAHGHCVDVPGMVAGLMHAQAVLVLEHLGAQGTAHLKGVVGPLEVQRQVRELYPLAAHRAGHHAHLLTPTHVPSHTHAHSHIRYASAATSTSNTTAAHEPLQADQQIWKRSKTDLSSTKGEALTSRKPF